MLVVLVSLLSLSLGNTYCPSASDLTVAYGSPALYNQGWSITGSGAAATKAAFNLIGGSVEFDVDFASTNVGVNANIYTISPSLYGSSFTQAAYCDGSKSGSQWCAEVDWIETNGNCGGQTTVHTRQGTGNNGCTAWGCLASYLYNGAPSFHMKISYATSGEMTIVKNGQTIGPDALSPAAQAEDWNTLLSAYQSTGAVIYSSQWVGWVPESSCGSSSGDLSNSAYSISNLRITGTVVSGPTPALCSGSGPAPTNAPPTHAAPVPTQAPPTYQAYVAPTPTHAAPTPYQAAPTAKSGSTYCVDAPATDGNSCAQHKAWGNCGQAWMAGQCAKTCGLCGPCQNIPVPGDPNTCAQQAGWGNCGQSYMSGRCDVACGRCVPSLVVNEDVQIVTEPTGSGRAPGSGTSNSTSSSTSNSTISSASSPSPSKIGIIVGSVVGGILLVGLFVGLMLWWHRSSPAERI